METAILHWGYIGIMEIKWKLLYCSSFLVVAVFPALPCQICKQDYNVWHSAPRTMNLSHVGISLNTRKHRQYV